jgi:hypothetical protein
LGVYHGAWRYRLGDDRLDGYLLDVGQHLDNNLAIALDHAQYGWFLIG